MLTQRLQKGVRWHHHVTHEASRAQAACRVRKQQRSGSRLGRTDGVAGRTGSRHTAICTRAAHELPEWGDRRYHCIWMDTLRLPGAISPIRIPSRMSCDAYLSAWAPRVYSVHVCGTRCARTSETRARTRGLLKQGAEPRASRADRQSCRAVRSLFVPLPQLGCRHVIAL